MSLKQLAEHHLEFLSLKGGCTGSSEYTLVKMPHCWKSYVAAHIYLHSYATSHETHSYDLDLGRQTMVSLVYLRDVVYGTMYAV